MATYKNITLSYEFLQHEPTAYYVFPDNFDRQHCEFTSDVRQHPHALGFIAKKFSEQKDSSYYKPEEYSTVFFEELLKLKKIISKNPHKTYYIAYMKDMGVNKFLIWQRLMEHNIVKYLEPFDNVVFCWDGNL